jgi:hypothetical protein
MTHQPLNFFFVSKTRTVIRRRSGGRVHLPRGKSCSGGLEGQPLRKPPKEFGGAAGAVLVLVQVLRTGAAGAVRGVGAGPGSWLRHSPRLPPP